MTRTWRYGALMLGLILGCGADRAPASPPDTAADAVADSTAGPAKDSSQPTDTAPDATPTPGGDTTPSPDGDTTPDVLPLGEALHAECPDGGSPSQPYPNAIKKGNDLHKVTLDAPTALCNDGSPAVMFIRAALTPAGQGRWVIYLQGGGSCGTYEECHDRYCSFKTGYDASKMSSNFTPESINGSGMQENSPQNPFNDANQVYFYYCSSDTWAGRKSDAVVHSQDNTAAFRIHFRGHSILEAGVAKLLAGVTSDDGKVTVPPLQDADRVLWTGVSGGGAGATHNADWFTAQLTDGDKRVRAIIDAGINPEAATYPPDIEAIVNPNRVAFFDNTWTALYNGFADQSCVAHAANQGADAWRCSLPAYVKLNHVTTPFFQRLDLHDPVGSKSVLGIGATIDEFANAAIQTLQHLHDIRTTALEAGAITTTPGIYGPSCGQHVAITNNSFFFETTLADPQGKAWTFAAAVEAWLQGKTVNIIDTEPASQSVCAPTTPERS